MSEKPGTNRGPNSGIQPHSWPAGCPASSGAGDEKRRTSSKGASFESDVPVVVQHTHLDSRQAENALPSHTQATISGPFVADEDGYLGGPELAPAAYKKSIDGFR